MNTALVNSNAAQKNQSIRALKWMKCSKDQKAIEKTKRKKI
jgi:hypothetical protein